MSSPTSNTVSYTWETISPSLGNMAGVLSGNRWTSTSLDYSFPGSGGSSATHATNYGSYGGAEWNTWYYLNGNDQAAVNTALDVLEGIGGLHFAGPIADTSTQVGLLRFAGSSYVTAYAYAYYPFSDASSGDVWFSDDWFNGDVRPIGPGDYDFMTIMHEVGHALGLKHPFETSAHSANLMPAQYDSLMYTIMSYDTVAGDTDSGAYFYPTTPMYYDVAALEYMYGPSTKNLGNTTHTYSSSGQYWETLVDGGGTDTLVYNSAPGESTRMSLLQGDYCEFGQAIHYFNVPAGQEYDYRTVWIGPSTVIENATGGPGLETIIGNAVANMLQGLGGNDKLQGNGGDDKLYGGDGGDKLYGGAGHDTLNGGGGADKFVFDLKPVASSSDTLSGFSTVQDLIWIDHADFGGLPLGTLVGAKYREGGNVDAVTTGTGQAFLYDTDSGDLYYDSNGAAAGGKILIAKLAGAPDISNTDIVVI